MNKKLRISMIVVVTVVLLMSVTIQSLAEKPDKFFTLEAIYEFSGDTLTYSGTFDSEGAIADEGTSWGHWVLTQGGDFRLTSFFQSNELTQDMFVVAIRLDDELDEEIEEFSEHTSDEEFEELDYEINSIDDLIKLGEKFNEIKEKQNISEIN